MIFTHITNLVLSPGPAPTTVIPSPDCAYMFARRDPRTLGAAPASRHLQAPCPNFRCDAVLVTKAVRPRLSSGRIAEHARGLRDWPTGARQRSVSAAKAHGNRAGKDPLPIKVQPLPPSIRPPRSRCGSGPDLMPIMPDGWRIADVHVSDTPFLLCRKHYWPSPCRKQLRLPLVMLWLDPLIH